MVMALRVIGAAILINIVFVQPSGGATSTDAKDGNVPPIVKDVFSCSMFAADNPLIVHSEQHAVVLMKLALAIMARFQVKSDQSYYSKLKSMYGDEFPIAFAVGMSFAEIYEGTVKRIKATPGGGTNADRLKLFQDHRCLMFTSKDFLRRLGFE